MKKYRFYLTAITYLDFTEEQYNNLEDCDCSFSENELLLEGKIIKGDSHFTHKYPIMIITPKENFEVIDDIEEIIAPEIKFKNGKWDENKNE